MHFIIIPNNLDYTNINFIVEDNSYANKLYHATTYIISLIDYCTIVNQCIHN